MHPLAHGQGALRQFVQCAPDGVVGLGGRIGAAHLTQAQLIEEMLEERRKAEFWAALEAETPDQEYLDDLAEADAAFAGDAEESIARFEAGE